MLEGTVYLMHHWTAGHKARTVMTRARTVGKKMDFQMANDDTDERKYFELRENMWAKGCRKMEASCKNTRQRIKGQHFHTDGRFTFSSLFDSKEANCCDWCSPRFPFISMIKCLLHLSSFLAFVS